jgi:hypothetical protein
MKRFSLRAIVAIASLGFLASCNGSSSSGGFLGNLPGPNTPTGFTRMYDALCGEAKVFVVAPPFAAPLTASASFSHGCGWSLAFAQNGTLAASSAVTSAVRIFNPPYSSSSTPTVTIAGGGSTLTQPSGIAWDGSGNLWVADRNLGTPGVKEFAPPFSAGSAPVATNSTAPVPVGLAINPSAGLMFIGDVGGNLGPGDCHIAAPLCHVYIVPAPYTGAPIATFTFGSSTPVAIAVDQLGRLFVGFESGGFGGLIKVYLPPFATGNSAAYTLTVGSPIWNLAFDSGQNLYAQLDNGTVVVFNGPILGSITAPSAVLGCPTTAGICPAPGDFGGLAVGP